MTVALDPPSLLLVALGLLVGLTLALTGAGGGALAVPLLVLGAGWTIQQASPAALMAVALAAALGAAQGLRRGLVRWRAALLLGAAGMAVAPAGIWLAQRTPQPLLLLAFIGFMVLTAVRMGRLPAAAKPATATGPACRRPDGDVRLQWTRACAGVMVRIGATAGLLSGLLGVGGGFVIVPALDRHSNLDLRTIQATSLAVISLVSLSGLTAAAWVGRLTPGPALPFALGAVAGLLLGRLGAHHVPEPLMRRGFAAAALSTAALLLIRVWQDLA